uniref:NADH:quinone oxidoreductase/Mrp antiporter transmembrane domain-containing protein n=1 Tax=candidate division WOR-3 bacterium TaxID=2052148 RepID=A0A7V4E462_UNCW3
MVNPILIIALLLLFAFLMPLLGLLHRRLPAFATLILPAFNLYVAVNHFLKMDFIPVVIKTGGFRPPFGINLAVDHFSLFFLILVNAIGVFIALSYLLEEQDYRFHILFLLNLLGASGIILTGDLFNSFVFLEILAISSYALAGSRKEKPALEGAIKYLIIGSIGASFYLLGVFILYKVTGTLNIADIALKLQNAKSGIVYLAGMFMLVGLFVETELFPLNTWAPDVYQGAYNRIAVQFSSLISKAAIYLLFRITFLIFDDPLFYKLLLVVGLLTFVVAEFNALAQKDLKRMLGYSSIGQMGLAVLAFALYGMISHPEAFFAATLLIVNHAIAKALLFANMDNMSENATIDIRSVNPFSSLMFAIGALSVMGFPFTLGFWAKIEILGILLRTNLLFLFFLIILIFMVEAFYYFRVITNLFRGETVCRRLNPLLAFSLVVFSIFLVYQGFYPIFTFSWLNRALNALLNKAIYISIIAGGL